MKGATLMEELRAFIEKIGLDNELKAKVEALGEKANQPDEVITLAAEYGFTVTIEDCEQELAKTESGELDEEELKAIAGGGSFSESICWFRPSGNTDKSENYILLHCDHDCYTFLSGGYCGCHGTDNCQNKWHRVDNDRILAPNYSKNHKSKNPDNNYKDPNYKG